MEKTSNTSKKFFVLLTYFLFAGILVSGSLVFVSKTESISFNTSGATRLTITSDGKVGINDTNPATTLTVDGIIKTTPRSSATCDSNSEGGIYYDSDDNQFYGCNSTDWVKLSTTFS